MASIKCLDIALTPRGHGCTVNCTSSKTKTKVREKCENKITLIICKMSDIGKCSYLTCPNKKPSDSACSVFVASLIICHPK